MVLVICGGTAVRNYRHIVPVVGISRRRLNGQVRRYATN
jgi:hypothetical protein